MAYVVGCKCGKSHVIKKEYDKDYGAFYYYIECKECDYYWEGFM